MNRETAITVGLDCQRIGLLIGGGKAFGVGREMKRGWKGSFQTSPGGHLTCAGICGGKKTVWPKGDCPHFNHLNTSPIRGKSTGARESII